jgi:hypothetical protein
MTKLLQLATLFEEEAEQMRLVSATMRKQREAMRQNDLEAFEMHIQQADGETSVLRYQDDALRQLMRELSLPVHTPLADLEDLEQAIGAPLPPSLVGARTKLMAAVQELMQETTVTQALLTEAQEINTDTMRMFANVADVPTDGPVATQAYGVAAIAGVQQLPRGGVLMDRTG